jgi:hopanoid C-3 methylase
MKILFVRPKPSPETIGLQHMMIVEPLELEILSALRRPEDESFLADLIIEKKSLEHFLTNIKPDVLCITGYITHVRIIVDYCRTAKKMYPALTTIVGGVHCEVCPEDFDDPSVDFRVVRNAAIVFTQLLGFIAKEADMPPGVLTQGMIINEASLPGFNFSIPFPDRSITEKYRHKYFYIFHNKVALIKTSFGCPYSCTFCFCRVITRNSYWQRPMDEVILELKDIKEENVYIVDDDFLTDRKRLCLFVSELRRNRIRKYFLVYGRADFIANNPDLISELHSVGLHTVIVGFESFSEKELKNFNKKTSPEDNKKAMAILNENHIDCYATIILSPDWDSDDFKQMVNKVKELGIQYVNLQPLTPLPKTGISYHEDNLLIKNHEYEKWDLAHVSVKPTRMTVSDYYRHILKAYYEILFRRTVLWSHFRRYNIGMLWKMLLGSQKVTYQYKKKLREEHDYA